MIEQLHYDLNLAYFVNAWSSAAELFHHHFLFVLLSKGLVLQNFRKCAGS